MNSHQKQQEEDQILLAHVRDLCRRNAWRSFTGFLDMRQYTMLKMHLSQDCCRFSGGYPEAERGVLCIHPQDCPPTEEEFPFVCLTIRFRKEDKLTHRDVLGSFMSQQIQRDRIGDILVSPGKIQCFVMEQIAPVLLSIRKIGRIGVQITDQEKFSGTYAQNMQEISGVVSSTRLDAVLKAALRIRRQECVGLILAGKVMCNYQEVTKPDLLLQAGDVFSVRGYGKFRLDAVGAPTQKNRLHIVIQKYL
ncbi:MAG: RNA-binding protein [Oscillospiraceae bacterium]|nr:RNA-binding protein [Oscillospiraceae bacterium]